MRRVTFSLPASALDEALDGLLAILPGGVRLTEGIDPVAVAVEGGFVPDREDLEGAAGRPLPDYAQSEVPDDASQRAVAGQGVRSGRIVVRGERDEPAADGQVEVVVEPRSTVFGSGSHPTTRMCLALMQALAPEGGLADLGCGLGTLAIAGAKLGWDPVVAVDREPAAAAATAEHAHRNRVPVQTSVADLTQSPVPYQPTLVVNSAPAVQEAVVSGLPDQVHTVIVSSFVEAEEERVLALWRGAGFEVRERLSEDMWVAATLVRGQAPAGHAVDASAHLAEPPAPSAYDGPLLGLDQILDVAAPVQAGAALGQLASGLPDGGMVVSTARLVTLGCRAAILLVPGLFRFDVTPRHETLGIAIRSLTPAAMEWNADEDAYDGFRRDNHAPMVFRARAAHPERTIQVWIQLMTVSDEDHAAVHFVAKAAIRPAPAA